MLLNTEVQAGLHVKYSLKLSSVWGMIIYFSGWLYCKYSCILIAKWEGFVTAVTWNHCKLGHPCSHCQQLFLQIKVSVPTKLFWASSLYWHFQPFKENSNFGKKHKSWKVNSHKWMLGAESVPVQQYFLFKWAAWQSAQRPGMLASQWTIVGPKFRPFYTKLLTTLWTFYIINLVDCLALWNEIKVNDIPDVEGSDRQCLHLWLPHVSFLGSWRCQFLPSHISPRSYW